MCATTVPIPLPTTTVPIPLPTTVPIPLPTTTVPITLPIPLPTTVSIPLPIRKAKQLDGAEKMIAIVKADKLNSSSPSQHAADFHMMMHMARSSVSSSSAFLKRMVLQQNGSVKPVVHFEVDGGPDENPSHVETRFLLAEISMGGPSLNPNHRRKQVGASTCESGASAKNAVERDNGCITQATAGMVFNIDAFGDLQDPSTGKLDKSKVCSMWEHHIEQYTHAVDGAPALNGAKMCAFPGATASSCDDAQPSSHDARSWSSI